MIASVAIGLFALLALTVPVGIVLFMLGFGVEIWFSPFPSIRGLGQVIWSSSNSSILIAIPFFVLLGEILVRGGVATRTYSALDTWLGWLPGGLVHANIGTATMFSATSGSSVATAATVATVAMPQAERLGYDPRLFSGAIAAGDTLGILIPPSINLIIYGFLTETSIPRLFLAGLVPGLLMAIAFIVVTVLIYLARPDLGGPRRSYTWAQRTSSLQHLMPIIAVYFVLGFFVETLSLMVATIPITVPIIAGLGFDTIWFGVLMIVLVEMALITPPVGMNLHVVQGARGSGHLGEVMFGALPYVAVMLAMIVALLAFLQIALYLPERL